MTDRIGVVFHKNKRAAFLQPPRFLFRHDGGKAEPVGLLDLLRRGRRSRDLCRVRQPVELGKVTIEVM